MQNWENITAVLGEFFCTFGLQKDGTIVTAGNGIEDWKDVAAISVGSFHYVGIKKDGSIVSLGDNKYGQCNVESWGNQKGNK